MSELRKEHKLDLYALAAGFVASGTALANPTSSAVAPATIENDIAGGPTLFELLDIDGNGVDDFELSVRFDPATCLAGNDGRLAISREGNSRVVAIDSSDEYAANISAGTTIGPGSNFDFGSRQTLTPCFISADGGQPELGEFNVGESGFVGLEIDRNGQIHYGYLEVEVFAGSIGINILDACYESEPDTPLAAGACIVRPIPVNAVAIPLVLGLMALGGLALGRRRQAAR